MQSNATGDGRPVLLTGATGFVGKAALGVLRDAGLQVICASRDPKRARREGLSDPALEIRRMDTLDNGSVQQALEGCSSAVYLVHSMASSGNYADAERKSATTFRDAAAQQGLERIVYLGGMHPNGKPSKHLASRLRTGQLLRDGLVPTIELQATMIIGCASESFRMVRDLAARLPFMILPRWMRSRTEPIALDDVTFAVLMALTRLPAQSAVFTLPGPERLSAKEILERTAAIMGRAPRSIFVPVLTPRLSSYWIRLITRSNPQVARQLVEGLRTDILAKDRGLWELFPEHMLMPFDRAVSLALNDEQRMLSFKARVAEWLLRQVAPRVRRGHH